MALLEFWWKSGGVYPVSVPWEELNSKLCLPCGGGCWNLCLALPGTSTQVSPQALAVRSRSMYMDFWTTSPLFLFVPEPASPRICSYSVSNSTFWLLSLVRLTSRLHFDLLFCIALERSTFSSQEHRSFMSESINILAIPSIGCMTLSKLLNLFESKTIFTKNNMFSWGLFFHWTKQTVISILVQLIFQLEEKNINKWDTVGCWKMMITMEKIAQIKADRECQGGGEGGILIRVVSTPRWLLSKDFKVRTWAEQVSGGDCPGRSNDELKDLEVGEGLVYSRIRKEASVVTTERMREKQ